MPLPLVPLLVLGGAALLARGRGGAAGNGPDQAGDTAPSSPRRPYPPPPWAADRQLPNAGDCGWSEGGHAENGDAHLARYLARRWHVQLPAGIENWPLARLQTWEFEFVHSLKAKGDAGGEVAVDVDGLMYGCLGKKVAASVKRAWEDIRNLPEGAIDAASDAAHQADRWVRGRL